MPAPPLVRRSLRPALGRILPFLLPPERSQIEETPGIAERLDGAIGSEVGPKDAVAITQEDAQSENFAFVAGETKVDIEVAAGGRVPRTVQPMRFL